MRGLITFFISLLILIGLMFQDFLPDAAHKEAPSKISNYKGNEQKVNIPDDAVSKWMGKDKESFIEEWGDPERIDPSAYGYEWYIYGNESTAAYLQAGVQNGKIVSLFVLGSEVNTKPFTIGESTAEINKKFPIQSEVTISEGESFFRFELSEQEVMLRPLIEAGKGVWVQLYFDKFTNKLSSVRYITSDILLKHKPYSIVYRGELPGVPMLSEKEQLKVDESEQKQIFELTNVIRKKYDLQALEWDEPTSEVAFLHSKDMAVQNYFSHESKDGRTLSDRLNEGEITFLQAGENIAANYTDGIAAVEGWMNSEGHRKTLLNKEYTHLGVGVYKKYYTQDFLVPFK
jgi:uncharacterized protein YkwD